MLDTSLLITISGWVLAVSVAVTWYMTWFSKENQNTKDATSALKAKQTFYKFKADHLETTLNACPDAVFITNHQGIITYVNPSSEQIFGFSAEELIGNNVSMLMPEHIAQYHHQYLIDFHLTGKTGTIGRHREITCKRKDNTIFPAELSLGASKEANGYIFIGIITDISERKHAEYQHRRSEQLRETLTQSAEGIMLLFSTEGVCRLANKSAITSIGKTEQEIIGKSITEFLSESVALERLRCIKLAKECRESFCTHDFRNGRTFENTYTPIIDEQNNVSDVAIHAVDITERLKYETSLKKAKQTAEEANKAKTLFITKVSHELKNPLHSILGFAHLVQDTLSNKPPKNSQDLNELNESIQTIITSGSHILSLINDLLDVSSSELGVLPTKLSAVSSERVIADTLEMMKPIAKAAGIALEIQPNSLHETIHADYQRLKQVLTNLISNAIKYNHSGGKVSIHSYMTRDHHLAIAIQDNGIGIPEKDQQTLFSLFNRAENSTVASGHGLGLNLCKQFMERMNGSIHFNSQLDQGSRFWIKLPLSHSNRVHHIHIEPERTPAKSSISTQKAPMLKLLMIEDNPSNIRLLKKLTARVEGYQFYQAETCATGEKLLCELEPDILILDINLPDGEGSKLLKHADKAKHIVVLSAFIEHDQIVIPQDKVDLVLQKPMNVRQLTDQLEEWKQSLLVAKSEQHPLQHTS